MTSARTKKLVFAAVIAAAYSALSLLLAPISFGQVQCRVAEALTILPVFNTAAIWGVTLGCMITNFIGISTGANILGAMDVFVGTAATLIAALLTARLGKYRTLGLPLLATLPPVLINALAIGLELNLAVAPAGTWNMLPVFAGFIAFGQLGSCTLLGLLLFRALERSGAGETLRKI